MKIFSSRTGKEKFREDLYHRFNEFSINVPALRNRPTDLLIFADHFLKSANIELNKNIKGFDDDVVDCFRKYYWPGNIREMKNVIKRAVLLTHEGDITVHALPVEMLEAIRNPPSKTAAVSSPVYDLKTLQESQEKEMILKTLKEVRYNKSKAARILNIDRKTLYLKIEKYGIE